MNVLLAEDDAIARMTLSAVLKGLGYDVTAAEHGGEAWANLQLGHFPIVISDWQMPEIDGPELHVIEFPAMRLKTALHDDELGNACLPSCIVHIQPDADFGSCGVQDIHDI